MRTAGKIYIVFYRAVVFVVVAAAVLLAVLFAMGIRPYAVRTGSMEPAIHQGSLCFVNHRTPFEEVQKGQVIAFKSGEMLVTHRVVRIDSDGIITKGDANNTEDAKKVTKENYIGKNEAVIPFLGKFPLFARTPSGKFIVIGGFVLFLITGSIYDRAASRMNKKEKNKAAAGSENDTAGDSAQSPG